MCVYFPCNSDFAEDVKQPSARKVRHVQRAALHEGYDFGKIFPLLRIPLNGGIQERDFGYFSAFWIPLGGRILVRDFLGKKVTPFQPFLPDPPASHNATQGRAGRTAGWLDKQKKKIDSVIG
jgi:hypothetical protein